MFEKGILSNNVEELNRQKLQQRSKAARRHRILSSSIITHIKKNSLWWPFLPAPLSSESTIILWELHYNLSGSCIAEISSLQSWRRKKKNSHLIQPVRIWVDLSESFRGKRGLLLAVSQTNMWYKPRLTGQVSRIILAWTVLNFIP